MFRLEEMSPTWAFVRSVAAQVPAVGAKLSPSFPHDELPLGCEAQWTSWGGDLVECAVWWGPLVRHQGRSALEQHYFTVVRCQGRACHESIE